jgi:diguanylate cyclase (GGDEF)-like protein
LPLNLRSKTSWVFVLAPALIVVLASVFVREFHKNLDITLGGALLCVILALAALNRELTRRRDAELAFLKQQKLLESILNGCSDAVIVADSEGKIILRNPVAVRDHFDLSAVCLNEDYPRKLGLYKKDTVSLFPVAELPLSRAIRGEVVSGTEIYVRHPDGSEPRWKLSSGGPLIDEKGQARGGVIFLRDITDRKEADEKLTAALHDSEANARQSAELSNLADLFQFCQTVEEACKMSEKTLPPLFEAQAGALCFTNGSRNLVEAAAIWNGCATTQPVFQPSDCWALRLGKPYASADSGSPLRCAHVSPSYTGDYFCVPLAAQGETLGVLYTEDELNTCLLSSELDAIERKRRERRAIAVAERISLAMANIKLRQILRDQSIRDPLTGLFNRRYLEESLNRELARSVRSGRTFSIAMIDLDHFKSFNDTFGHQAGDFLLREVANIFKTRVRAGDLACRFGGEEFAFILSETDANGAQICVEKLREEVKRLILDHRGQKLGSITMSAGVASFPFDARNGEDLIHAADEALYTAKKEGRDRVIIFQGDAKEQADEPIASGPALRA